MAQLAVGIGCPDIERHLVMDTGYFQDTDYAGPHQ